MKTEWEYSVYWARMKGEKQGELQFLINGGWRRRTFLIENGKRMEREWKEDKEDGRRM